MLSLFFTNSWSILSGFPPLGKKGLEPPHAIIRAMQIKTTPPSAVTYREAFWVWVRIALLSFGGPAGQIAVMHKILVEEKKWINENRFLHALNYCMFLPGPEAQQLATYIGWVLHGTRGGLTAGLLFILPGFISILILSVIFALFHELPAIGTAFFVLKAAVLALVIEAILRIGKKALKNEVMLILAVLAFSALFFLNAPFPAVIACAALTGYLGGKILPEKFHVIKPRAVADEPDLPVHTKPSWSRSFKVILIWGVIWFAPLAGLALGLGPNHVLVQEALFFSKAAVVTFGGAYSVLAYIAQQAVHTFHWLNAGEMLTGLGMAETTPGPLIQVVQFVGFMGAYRNPAPFSPLTSAVLGSIVTTWMTFAPCFLWIFLGAPLIEHLRENKSVSTALSGITAAVVGVIANLALWFSMNVLFTRPGDIRSFNLPAFLIAGGTLAVMHVIGRKKKVV